MKVSGKSALEFKLPFDEREVLELNKQSILKEAQVENLEVKFYLISI